MKTSGESPITWEDGWFAGEDQAIQWVIYDRDPATETNPPTVKNITGWTLQFKMATTEGGAASLTKSAALTTPASGVCTVATAQADTAGLAADTYYYTLSRTDSGFNAVVAWGTAVLRARPS